jgi:hypothetical protein
VKARGKTTALDTAWNPAMATAMKEIQDKLSNQDKLRGLEKHTAKPLVHPKHDLINKVRPSSSPETLGHTRHGAFCAPPCFPVEHDAGLITRAGS